MHPEWLDLEEEKVLSKPEKKEEQEEQDWDGTQQKKREQELKSDKSNLETVSPSENINIKEDAPQLTDTLIGTLPSLPPEEEEKKDKPYNSDDSEFFKADSESDSEIDNIV